MLKKIDENLMLFSTKFVKQKEYWSGKFSGEMAETLLVNPSQNQRHQYNGENLPILFPQPLSGRLMKLSKQSDLSLYILLLTGLKVLLYQYTNNEEISVLSPLYHRNGRIPENFLNDRVLIRDGIDSNLTFKECVLTITRSVLEAYENQDYPFDKLMEHLFQKSPSKDTNGFSSIVCTLQNIHGDRQIHYFDGRGMASFSFKRLQNRILGDILYDANMYEQHFLHRVREHFIRILEQSTLDVDTNISKISFLSNQERHQLIHEFNKKKAELPKEHTVYQLFEKQAKTNPDRMALVYKDNECSYGHLNQRANQWARILKKKGIQKDKPAAILLDRKPLMLETILAVWKAGGVYIPLEPQDPVHRIKGILEEAGAHLLLTDMDVMEEDSFLVLQHPDPERVKPKFTITGPRPRITDFDALPFPDRSLLDYEKYTRYIGQAMGKYNITLQATRGCPYNCIYCHRIFTKKHVVRSAKNIFSEVKLFYDIGIRRFVIIDDIFNFDRKNSTQFFQMIIKNRLKVEIFFPNGLRGDRLDKEYIDLMMEAGTINMALALETASPRIQRLIKKHLDLEKLEENLQYICKAYPHVLLELFTMHGFPTESEEEAMKTLDFIKRQKWLHFPYIEILKIFPGTGMEKLALEQGISKEAIGRSQNLAFHEPSENLPFDRSFTSKYQSDFFNSYFLSNERLLHVLPYQMEALTEDEILQKYNSYLPVDIYNFNDLLQFLGIDKDELRVDHCRDEDSTVVPHLNEKIAPLFPAKSPHKKALRILLLDISHSFSKESHQLNYMVETPLGLMYLMSYLNREFGNKVHGKIAISLVDYDSFHDLRALIDEFKPDVIGMRTLTFYKNLFHKTASFIRQWGFKGPIIAGGPYATSGYATVLQDRNVDLAVIGEGEITLKEVIRHILENEGKLPGDDILKQINGIVFVPEEDKKRLQQSPGWEIVMLDTLENKRQKIPGKNLAPPHSPGDLAYVIYTSGSTGKPKGAMLEHIGMMNHIRTKVNDLGITADSVIAQNASHTFDISVWQFFAALTTGGQTIIYPHELILNPGEFLLEIQNNRATILEVVPTYLSALLDFTDVQLHLSNFHHLKYLLVTGDVIKPNLVRRWFEKYPGIKMVNAYGPTEASDDITHYVMDKMPDAQRIPIGKPVQNMDIYILDKNMNLCPLGITGEICVSGVGVGRGYLNNPELTAEKFYRAYRSHKSYIPKKIYRTGDLGCWLPDGTIEFFGRKDYQIKIRGYRIELGEIENKLVNFPGIKEAVVVDKQDENQNKYLCAYFTANQPGSIDISEVKGYLASKIPDYMNPAHVVELEQVPLTANGKINRNALPEPQAVKKDIIYEAPGNETEEKLLGVWSNVLGIKKELIGTDINFFELGGDSIKAIQIAARIQKYGLSVNVRDLFQHPTIKQLAKCVKKTTQVIDQAVVEGEVELTPIQRWFFDMNFTNNHHFNQSLMIYSQLGFDEEKIKNIFTKLVEHHDALRMVYQLEENRINQVNQGMKGNLFDLEVIDLIGKNDIEEKIEIQSNRIQGGIDLNKGPLVKLGLYKTQHGDHLLIVIHHLVIDGVSWRILLEDFVLGYRQMLSGKEIKFQNKTHSYKYWAEKLVEYANSNELQEELAFWEKIENSKPDTLPKDYEVEMEMKKRKYSDTIYLQFDETTTDQLLRKVNQAYNTNINDILLTALVMALNQWSQMKKIAINLEGHGRDVLEDIDISRTVGWFTTISPVLFDISGVSASPGNASQGITQHIKLIKETLRQVPGKGFGLGVIKFLMPENKKKGLSFSLKPEIVFNYLGGFGQKADRENSLVKMSGMNMGSTDSPEREISHSLDINGVVANRILKFSISYNKNEYEKSSIEKLAVSYQSHLNRIIAHCVGKEETELTASDFSTSDINENELEMIFDELEGKF